MDVIHQINRQKVIPVINLEDPKDIDSLFAIYNDFGINCVEITFRNKKTESILHYIAKNYDNFIVGAGTVRNYNQFQIAKENGVKFIVTPGFNSSLVRQILDKEYNHIFPGIDSTLGIEETQKLNLKILKFFPASVNGGTSFLKAMQGPYADLKFIPTGGISLGNLEEYLKLDNVLAAGGSFLAPKKLILEKKWDDIRSICGQTMDLIRNFQNSL